MGYSLSLALRYVGIGMCAGVALMIAVSILAMWLGDEEEGAEA